jgi:hypothetical protein
MKLFRFGPVGQEQPGVLTTADELLDVSAFGEDYGESFFATAGLARLAAWLETQAAACPRVPAGTRLGPCVGRPSKLVAIGLNLPRARVRNRPGYAHRAGLLPESALRHLRP